MRTKSTRHNKSRRCNKHSKCKRNTKRFNKRRAQKGGLFNISLGLNGKNLLGKTYGKKYYEDGEFKPQTCTKILGLEYCKLNEQI